MPARSRLRPTFVISQIIDAVCMQGVGTVVGIITGIDKLPQVEAFVHARGLLPRPPPPVTLRPTTPRHASRAHMYGVQIAQKDQADARKLWGASLKERFPENSRFFRWSGLAPSRHTLQMCI